MGVPKFYRWISERYPLITQRHGVRATEALARDHFERAPPEDIPHPDPLSTCGLPPPIDRLYIDMNGIIHGCSHNNRASTDADSPDENAVAHITEAEIFRNIRYYLDRLVKEVAQPRELMYIAIDGVAARAKLNQQRARRYRSAQEGEIERTVYDAHKQAVKEKMAKDEEYMAEYTDIQNNVDVSQMTSSSSSSSLSSSSDSGLREVEPGRFTGKFETKQEDSQNQVSTTDGSDNSVKDGLDIFHSNYITPGTPFFQRCTAFLEEFIRDRIANDPAWQQLDVIFSGPNTPGEGEHKIMQFLREQKTRPDYDPNLRHCIVGQDGDLILLGLASHEPNLVLLREQVLFDKKRRAVEGLAKKYGLDLYLFNPNFEFLHMNVLRDYLALEFETSNVVSTSPFDIERTLDDFVFMTFFVGNDFLPHMPALDIGDEALDLLFYTYRIVRRQWQEEYEADPDNVPPPYLTHAGEIVSGKRLERFLQYVGRYESNYYAYKEKTTDYDQLRKTEAKFGDVVTPSDEILRAKENADRHKYREMIRQAVQQSDSSSLSAINFTPVMASNVLSKTKKDDKKGNADKSEEVLLTQRMGNLLQYSVADGKEKLADYENEAASSLVIDETDFKGRYYADKFGFSPYDAEKHLALRKSYLEGLVWNLRYYYQSHKTHPSWEWFYPYHYGPMISDLIDLDSLLSEVSFEGRTGAPLKPFEQLLACLPASQAKLLPPPYQKLMTDNDSPIRDFYPQSFTVDMNGKRWPWEAVVLLPFIDSARLRDCATNISTIGLSPEELKRNEFFDATVMHKDMSQGSVSSVPLQMSHWAIPENQDARFHPILHPKTVYPLDGLPTLRDGSIHSMARRRTRVNVHGNRSRYQTAMLEVANEIPERVPLESLAKFIGQTVYINYPSLIESFVTAVSDSKICLRGNDPPKFWDSRQAASRKERVKRIFNSYSVGLGMSGTGGMTLPGADDKVDTVDAEALLYVRPFKCLKTLPDGTVVKTFAKYELEVPLFVLSWAPVKEDSRLKGVALHLEKDPYHTVKKVLTDTSTEQMTTKMPPKRRNLNLYDLYPGDSPSELGAMKKNATGRSFSTCSTPGIPSARAFSTHTTLASSTRLLSNTRLPGPSFTKKTAVNPRGRMLTAGVLFFAIVVGLKPVHASRYRAPSDLPIHSLSVASSMLDTESCYETPNGPVQNRMTPPLDFFHGTTTISFKYQGGIVAAVDSRASLGSYVGSKTTQKVLPINKSMLGTMAGGAADCTFWIRRLAAEAALHEVSYEKPMSVVRASRLLANSLYQNRAAGLSIGTMIMGFDDEYSPSRIFYVDNTGTRIEGDMFAVGSGSTYAQGILDTERRYDMTDEEAITLGLKAIRHATFRDAGSGGFINVYLIKPGGWIHVFRQDIASIQSPDEKE